MRLWPRSVGIRTVILLEYLALLAGLVLLVWVTAALPSKPNCADSCANDRIGLLIFAGVGIVWVLFGAPFALVIATLRERRRVRSGGTPTAGRRAVRSAATTVALWGLFLAFVATPGEVLVAFNLFKLVFW
jgi:heme/copper-type cytochrome/quinol oxidase subunit 2